MSDFCGQSVSISRAAGTNKKVLCRTLFCPPVDRVTASNQQRLSGIPIATYSDLYHQSWTNLRWSARVLANIYSNWSGTAFHARVFRGTDGYMPPMEAELDIVEPGSFIACDSSYWKEYFIRTIPNSFCLTAAVGDHDLACRDANGVVAAMTDLLMLSRATRLYIHAPADSTFCIPAIYGAGVPCIRMCWRSGYSNRNFLS